jgi:stage IV sporulation protein FB
MSDGRFYLGHLGSIPVYVMPEAALNLLLIWWWCDGTLASYMAQLIALLLVILIHESGHALMAKVLGMRGITITLAALGGFCTYGGILVPRTQLFISLAGPAANLITAAVMFFALPYAGGLLNIDPVVGMAYHATLIFSIFLGIFNLLPLFPLDGGQATLAVAYMITKREAAARHFTLIASVVAAGLACVGLAYINALSMFNGIMIALLLFTAFRTLR